MGNSVTKINVVFQNYLQQITGTDRTMNKPAGGLIFCSVFLMLIETETQGLPETEWIVIKMLPFVSVDGPYNF